MTLEEAVRGSDIISESVSVKPRTVSNLQKMVKTGCYLIARAFSAWIKKKNSLASAKVVDNWKMYEEYGLEDEEVTMKMECVRRPAVWVRNSITW